MKLTLFRPPLRFLGFGFHEEVILQTCHHWAFFLKGRSGILYSRLEPPSLSKAEKIITVLKGALNFSGGFLSLKTRPEAGLRPHPQLMTSGPAGPGNEMIRLNVPEWVVGTFARLGPWSRSPSSRPLPTFFEFRSFYTQKPNIQIVL